MTNCSKYHLDLSLNLDGRLSSARRAALLEHLENCADCRALDREMRAAQELALGLPMQRVGPEFSTTLWNRVRAGEGTPDAVFREPVPLLKKVQYVVAGAAAAAAVLVGLQLGGFLPGAGREPSVESNVARVDGAAGLPVDGVTTAPPAGRGRLLTKVPQRVPFHPLFVAEVGQEECIEELSEVQQLAGVWESRLANAPVHDARRTIEPHVGTLRGSASLMRWMQKQRIIQLDSETSAELRVVEASLDQLERAQQTYDVLSALRQLSRVDLQPLRKQFTVVCCQDPDEFFQRFREHFVQNRDVTRLRIRLDPQGVPGSAPMLIRFR